MPGETLLVISQTYPPDPAASGQYMHDVARAMAARGHRVVVLASARAYADPSVRYPPFQVLDGVEVRRLSLPPLGKGDFMSRIVAAAAFTARAALAGGILEGVSAVLAGTSLPLAPAAALAISRFRGIPFAWWVMEINPDEAVTAGMVEPGSAAGTALERLYSACLSSADLVVTLDRYMEAVLRSKHDPGERLQVVPPWPLFDGAVAPAGGERGRFRERHGLVDRYVVMYAGNVSPVHPVDTVLDAARDVRGPVDPVLVFVGGGMSGALDGDVPDGTLFLPYQPFAGLADLLTSADLHLVTMGDHMVGRVHPCKPYSILAAGRPMLFVGPSRCHVTDILDLAPVGVRVPHGDVEGVATVLARFAADGDLAAAMGRSARMLAADMFPRDALIGRFCDLVEDAWYKNC